MMMIMMVMIMMIMMVVMTTMMMQAAGGGGQLQPDPPAVGVRGGGQAVPAVLLQRLRREREQLWQLAGVRGELSERLPARAQRRQQDHQRRGGKQGCSRDNDRGDFDKWWLEMD